MPGNISFRGLLIFILLVPVSLLLLASCAGTTPSDSYNGGAADQTITGAQFDQYTLFRFDTSGQSHTMALASAADIVNNLQSPYVGEVLTFAVAADGDNPVNLIGGANVTIKPSALHILGNTTLTMYCEFDSITSGH